MFYIKTHIIKIIFLIMQKYKILSSEVAFPEKVDFYSILNNINNYRNKYIIITNAHSQDIAHRDSSYLNVHHEASLIISDSYLLASAVKFIYSKKIRKVFLGSEIVRIICEFSEKNNIKIGFYGSDSMTLDMLKNNIFKTYPKLDVPYYHSPPFSEDLDDNAIKEIEIINKLNVDVLFIGLGCPKQEKWMYKHAKNINSLTLGVGAAFDFIAKPSEEIPPRLHKLRLGWAYRLYKSPLILLKRYLRDGSLFIYDIVVMKLKKDLK